MKIEFSEHVLKKYSHVTLYENSFTGSRIVPCGQTDTTSQIVAFCNLANAPKSHVGLDH